MSGYRTLHRFSEAENEQAQGESISRDDAPKCPIFAVSFSPCQQTHLSIQRNVTDNSKAPLRLVTSSADGFIRAYRISDKTNKANVLDAAALAMDPQDVLLMTSTSQYPVNEPDQKITLGCPALSIIRNYVGEDPSAGEEIVAALRLDGQVAIWKRVEQSTYPDSEEEKQIESINIVKPNVELNIQGATGTTLKLLSPQYTGFSKHGIVMMVGMLDGSVSFHCTGIGIPDSSKCNDTSKFSEAGMILDSVGAGNAIPMSVDIHPHHHLTFAVGRKDGIVDIYTASSDSNRDDVYGNFRRWHHLTQHAGAPVRSLAFTPDGSLLISACDEGHIYIHDTSSFRQNDSIRLVGAIHNAHKGYILSIDVMPDSKRFVTASADRTIKVWNVATPNNGPVHTFDTGRDSMVWGVTCSFDGRRCVSSSDDGYLQVYSCDE